jgi:hypothetical protein
MAGMSRRQRHEPINWVLAGVLLGGFFGLVAGSFDKVDAGRLIAMAFRGACLFGVIAYYAASYLNAQDTEQVLRIEAKEAELPWPPGWEEQSFPPLEPPPKSDTPDTP